MPYAGSGRCQSRNSALGTQKAQLELINNEKLSNDKRR